MFLSLIHISEPTSNSSTSVMVTVNVVSEVEPSALVAVTVIVQLVAVS